MARTYSFTVSRGDTLVFDVAITRANSSGVQVPVNLTGLLDAWCTGKLRPTDPDSAAIFQVSVDDGGIVVTSVSGGTMQVTIHGVGMSLTYETEVYFDVRIEEANGTVTTVAEGKIVVRPSITQAPY